MVVLPCHISDKGEKLNRVEVVRIAISGNLYKVDLPCTFTPESITLSFCCLRPRIIFDRIYRSIFMLFWACSNTIFSISSLRLAAEPLGVRSAAFTPKGVKSSI